MLLIIAAVLLNGPSRAPHAPLVTPATHGRPVRECEFEAERTADISAAGLSALRLDAGAGSLRIVGKRGISTIQVRGHACASSRDFLDDLQLRARSSGGAYDVETLGPDNTYNGYARIDLVIEMPASLAARVSDGSGDAVISGVASLDIDDGSGELQIDDIAGDVTVDDGSGELSIANVGGDVSVDDGSGELDIRDIRGSVTIDDGSGSIRVARVGRDLTVISDGSGEIEQSGVNGSVRLPENDRRRRGR